MFFIIISVHGCELEKTSGNWRLFFKSKCMEVRANKEEMGIVTVKRTCIKDYSCAPIVDCNDIDYMIRDGGEFILESTSKNLPTTTEFSSNEMRKTSSGTVSLTASNLAVTTENKMAIPTTDEETTAPGDEVAKTYSENNVLTEGTTASSGQLMDPEADLVFPMDVIINGEVQGSVPAVTNGVTLVDGLHGCTD